ncbi:MAG: DUF1579 family protein [Planctomycetes bacterium]|nr:DUF1579 family protein [Planctomycetota bacterium]
MNRRYLQAGALCLVLTRVSALGAAEPAAETAKEPAAPATEQTTSPVPEMQRLALFLGSWNLMERHFNPRGEETATVQGKEEIGWTLDRHVLRRVYSSAVDNRRFQAVGLLAWSSGEKKYRGGWYDNTSTTGPSSVSGEWDDATRTMTFTLESAAADGSKVQHRVVEQFLSDDRRQATTYQVSGKDVVKRLEVEYRRSEPCPASSVGMRLFGTRPEQE